MKIKSIQEVAESIWTKEHSEVHYRVYDTAYTLTKDRLNELTRIESILSSFKKETIEAYQGRIEELEDQLATVTARYDEVATLIDKLPDDPMDYVRMVNAATTGCQSNGTVLSSDLNHPRDTMAWPTGKEMMQTGGKVFAPLTEEQI